MWHNLTNHPAHRDCSATGGSGVDGRGQEKSSENNSNNKNDDGNRQAGSGSG